MRLKNDPKYKAAKATLESALKTLKVQAKELWNEALRTLQETYPKLNGFSWTQYTPYFNDGDTCEFGVNSYPVMHYEGVPEDEDDYETYLPATEVHPEGAVECLEDLQNLLDDMDADTMKDLFGDHVRVSVSFKGAKVKVDVEDYDHD